MQVLRLVHSAELLSYVSIVLFAEFTGNTAADSRTDTGSDVEAARASQESMTSADPFTMSDLEIDVRYLQDHRDHYLSDGQLWTEL